MQAAKLIDARTPQWRQLEMLCVQLESRSTAKKLDARRRIEFAALYRSACADLALADSYQLPAETVRYLHQLVGRAHNQLYRIPKIETHGLWQQVFEDTPRVLFREPAVRLAAALFWLPFLAAMFLSSVYSPVSTFSETIVGREQLASYEAMHSEPFEDRTQMGGFGAGFYVWHNTTIGLRCFAWGLVIGVGGMFATVFNGIVLGTVFGHMTTVTNNELFFEFVTAHGPFELTAIVLSAAAGMKMGFALVNTGGLRRGESLMVAARDALPILYTSIFLFVGAAFIEGFLSPSAVPYFVKAFVGMICTLLLLGYLVVLGYTQEEESEAEGAGNALAARPTSPFDDPSP